jgi:hypothetical protein
MRCGGKWAELATESSPRWHDDFSSLLHHTGRLYRAATISFSASILIARATFNHHHELLFVYCKPAFNAACVEIVRPI